MHDIPPEQRLIVALDFDAPDKALALVDRLGEAVSFYKVGYELFIAGGLPLVQATHDRGKRVFLDLKIDDVVETVTRAVRRIAQQSGIALITIYGARATAQAAVAGRGNAAFNILQVSLLTSLGKDDLEQVGLLGPNARFRSVEEYVTWRAQQSIANGCDGVIASGQNAAMLRAALGPGPLIVCPGIRYAEASTDDHKRPAQPFETIAHGADYLVVGRPIRDAADPPAMAARIVADIERGLNERLILRGA